MRFTDNHMHIDPIRGEGVGAVKKFERAGGGHIFLVNKMAGDWGIRARDVEDFEQVFDKTVKLAGELEEATGVRVFPVLGVHPAEFVRLCEDLGVESAVEVGEGALRAAGDRVEEGKAAAIGEVGRPHFRVPGEVLEAANRLMTSAMEVAADVDCAVQLHTEALERGAFGEFATMARKAGLKPERVVKHYSPPFIREGEETGIMPSLVASREGVVRALEEGRRFLLESDYIDDLARPGAVVGPKSVPRVSRYLLDSGLLTDAELEDVHINWVERVYNLELD
ncbi:MAG: metal-dependent hydrolase [Euryarchaeota archaeon]|nr:metal-dependent hydrolase [Euryarchaeota archaeon]